MTSIDEAVIPLSQQGINVNPLRKLLATLVDGQAKQAQTIKRLEAKIQSLQQSKSPDE
ncbi:hypothetical protein ACTPOE_16635 [Castellaniella sp. WN]